MFVSVFVCVLLVCCFFGGWVCYFVFDAWNVFVFCVVYVVVAVCSYAAVLCFLLVLMCVFVCALVLSRLFECVRLFVY